MAATQQGTPHIPDWMLDSAEYRATLSILAFLDDPRCWRHVHSDAIDVYAMLDEAGWSGGQEVLLQAAASLHHNDPLPISLTSVVLRLGHAHLRAAINAMLIRANRPPLGESAEDIVEAIAGTQPPIDDLRDQAVAVELGVPVADAAAYRRVRAAAYTVRDGR